jgi:bifunctional non-homologous end joining protein LigD
LTTKRQTRKQNTESASSRGGDRLAPYRAKRRFEVTPEPAPAPPEPSEESEPGPAAPARSSPADAAEEKKTAAAEGSEPAGMVSPGGEETRPAAPLAFVVQKHDARRLHYDVRLEIGGVLVSWAVPRGPSYDPSVRRLAVQTEDHPMEYSTFEGRIPEGEYGAGDMLIWDRGTYETVPPGSERSMLEQGHVHLRMFGEKLVGQWHLVRTAKHGESDGKQSQWLMFKAKDAHANPKYDVIAERPESVVSGKLATRGPRRAGPSEQGKSARALRDVVGDPELATAVTMLNDPAQWLFEVKYDGYRLFACKAGPDVRLFTRHANDWTDRFAPVARGVAALKVRECVIDGEACVVDEHGRPSFGALQEWLAGASQNARIAYAAFDLLWLDGRDLRKETIEVRRELLEKLLEGQGAPLTFSRSVSGDVADLLRSAKEAGLEGLMAKRKGSHYIAGRSTQWVKLRFDRRQDCAIAGWIPLSGSKEDVGALLLGVVDGGKLVFAGRVGTGFDTRTRRELAKRIGTEPENAPTVDGAPKIKDAHWVAPSLVCECAFAEWTRDGSMRQPRYLGLREDKTPLECVREGDVPKGRSASGAGASAAQEPHEPRAARREGPKLANPDKVLFPRDAIRKRDIWDYYTAIAPVMIPHLSGRPLTLQRYPDGIEGEEWYQQNAPEKTPSFVRLVDTGPRHENKKRIVCDELETLQWLANLAALTIHQWPSHVPAGVTTRAAIDHALARPDYTVLDLDPGDGPWSHLVEVARAVRTLLEALKLESFVKTSGKRGVHVVIPLAPGPTHDEATGFAEQVARAVAKVLPKIATVERMKEKRGGKLYVDYGQNGEGRTIVSPYTIRARDGAVVSMPIHWDELDDDLDPTKFTIRTAIERVRSHGDLFGGVLTAKQKLPTL